ncbi:MAG: amino acid ABC transporter permease [Christensenellaceae bacterium]|nr:amino acid ABC transporter permease [Christensenellaceae bacterium]
MSLFGNVTMTLLGGFGTTCLIFAITLACALPLGLAISFGSMSRFKVVRAIFKTFVWIIRGTPLMLQIIVVFYGPGLIWGMEATSEFRMIAVLIAFIINYSAYFSEIYRGGIMSIPKGQYEAGHVLGMSKRQVFRKVILLQVVKRIVPPMSNEIITLVKDTSLARIIAVNEIIMVAQKYISAQALIWPLFYSAVFYLVFNGILTIIFGHIEKKLSYFKV